MHPPRRLRVLVVDPDSEGICVFLEALGHATLTAHDGIEALEIARSFRIDAVLLGAKDGAEIARRLRQLATHAPFVLIALTEHVDGCDLVLRKPIEVDELARVLHTAFPG